MAVKRKGQVFVLGTLLFTAMIAGIVLLNMPGGLGFTGVGNAKNTFESYLNEYPRVLNLAYEEGSSGHVQKAVTSFLAFQKYNMRRHGLEMKAHSVTTVPGNGSVTVLVSNFREVDMDAVVTVNGSNKSLGPVNPGETVKESFTQVPEYFSVEANLTASRNFVHVFTSSLNRLKSVYVLRVESEGQVWRDKKIY